MLVLSRKAQQEIVIGDRVTVRVLQVKGNTVRLGVSAPADVRVRRGELQPAAPAVEEEVVFSLADEDGLDPADVIPFRETRETAPVQRLGSPAVHADSRIRSILSQMTGRHRDKQ